MGNVIPTQAESASVIVMLFWIAAAVALASHGCGTGRFALMPYRIDHTLEAQLEAEVKGGL